MRESMHMTYLEGGITDERTGSTLSNASICTGEINLFGRRDYLQRAGSVLTYASTSLIIDQWEPYLCTHQEMPRD